MLPDVALSYIFFVTLGYTLLRLCFPVTNFNATIDLTIEMFPNPLPNAELPMRITLLRKLCIK